MPHLADQAPGAFAVHGVHQYAVASFPIANSGTDLHDFAGEIQSHDARHWHLDARHAPAGEDVMIVERGRSHLDDHIVGSGPRVGKVRVDGNAARTAVLMDDCCFHGILCWLVSAYLAAGSAGALISSPIRFEPGSSSRPEFDMLPAQSGERGCASACQPLLAFRLARSINALRSTLPGPASGSSGRKVTERGCW